MPTSFFTNKLTGKRVVIIGGTSGIGFAVAQGCLEFGASVIVASSSQERVDNAVIRLRESGEASRIAGYTIDLRGGSEGIKAVEARMSKFLIEQVREPFDHFVYTAGDSPASGGLPPSFGEIDLEQASERMHVRYWAPFAACKILHNSGLLREGGSITLTSGVLVIRPQPGSGAVGSGAALFTLAKQVSLEMAPIRCNIVVPGPVDTELFDRIPGGAAWLKSYGAKTTIGRVPGPHDTAEAYLYCMRDGSFTGQTIITDSGVLLR